MIVFMRAAPEVFYRHAISAFIGVRNRMQRLVQISHEMDHIAQCVCALCRIGILIFQNGELLANRLRHASFLSAKWLKRSALRAARYINVVPRSVLTFSA